jgi:hypothetical protein
LLATQFNRLSAGTRLTLVAVGGFAVASHASHAPLVAAMCIFGAAWIILTHALIERRLRAIGCLFAPLALGVAMTIVSGFVGFNELSLAPKRWPLALARSVADGPGRLYLEKNCAALHYAVCEVFANNIPGSVSEFLWSQRGLRYRATPAQMDQIRGEEQEIVLRAAASYPYAQATVTLRNIARQLIHFGPEAGFGQHLWLDSSGTPHLEATGNVGGWLFYEIQILSVLSTLLGLGWACWRYPVLRVGDQAMLLIVGAGIVSNAIICAVFSAVTDRYQGRVIWVLPVICMAMMLSRERNRALGALLNKPIHFSEPHL